MNRSKHTPVVASALLCAVLCAALVSPAFALRIGVGPFGLYNNANFSGTKPNSVSYQSNPGFGAGVMVDFYLVDDLILSVQPMVVHKGTEAVLKTSGVIIATRTIDATYLSVPIMLKVIGGDGPITTGARGYVSGGIEVGFLLDATAQQSLLGQELGEEDWKQNLEDVDLEANFAVGVMIPWKKTIIFAEGRYSQGLSNVATREQWPAIPDPAKQTEDPLDGISVKHTGLQLIFGLLFQFGERQ